MGYAIPDVAKPIFQQLIAHLQNRQERAVRVLDLGCSYGVNAALLKHDLSMPDLYEHWGREALVEAPSEQVIARDRRFFADLEDPEDITVIGLDQAEAAVAFGEGVGLLDEGLAVNLETEALPAAASGELALVDLVTSTGCVGYVTERSFERLLPAVMQGQSPWIGNFVLRMFPFDAIETTLEGAGYVTEKLAGRTFVQRRFTAAGEQEQVIEQLRERGIDPAGKETEGYLLAEFYLSRRARDAAASPIGDLLAA